MTSETKPCGCSKIVDLLVDYLEGRLSLRAREELDHHLSGCASCLTQLRTYRTTVSLLRGLCDDDLPSDLRNSVTSFLEARDTN